MNPPRSPREILLARHASARPALEAQQADLLARLAAPTAPAPGGHAAPRSGLSPLGYFSLLWRELVVPCRGAWAALAALWVAILAFQQLERFSSPAFAPPSQVDSALLALWFEQRRLLAEFGASLNASPAWPLAPTAPPGTEKRLPDPASPPLGALRPGTAPFALA